MQIKFTISVTVRKAGRTTSAPNSAHRLSLDKDQSLHSGILTYTSVVLLQNKC